MPEYMQRGADKKQRNGKGLVLFSGSGLILDGFGKNSYIVISP